MYILNLLCNYIHNFDFYNNRNIYKRKPEAETNQLPVINYGKSVFISSLFNNTLNFTSFLNLKTDFSFLAAKFEKNKAIYFERIDAIFSMVLGVSLFRLELCITLSMSLISVSTYSLITGLFLLIRNANPLTHTSTP